MKKLILNSLSEQENDSYVGMRDEIVSVQGRGLAIHNGVDAKGLLLQDQPSVNDNIFRNSNFLFSQNGTSWQGNTGNTYISDGWFLQHGGGSTSNAIRASGWDNTLKQVTRLTVTTLTGGGKSSFTLLSQRVSDVRRYAGKKMTISFWVKCNESTSVAIECGMNFADTGTPNRSTLVGRGLTQPGEWVKVVHTFTVPEISASDVVNNATDSMYIYLWLEAGDDHNGRTGGLTPLKASFNLGNFKLEFGEVATEYSPLSIRDEEQKVFEYYEKNTLLRFYSPVPMLDYNRQCALSVTFSAPKWTNNVSVTIDSEFANNPTVYSKNERGFTSLATANSAVSGARIHSYIADAEIQP